MGRKDRKAPVGLLVIFSFILSTIILLAYQEGKAKEVSGTAVYVGDAQMEENLFSGWFIAEKETTIEKWEALSLEEQTSEIKDSFNHDQVGERLGCSTVERIEFRVLADKRGRVIFLFRCAGQEA